jgi:hypothetical protein
VYCWSKNGKIQEEKRRWDREYKAATGNYSAPPGENALLEGIWRSGI